MTDPLNNSGPQFTANLGGDTVFCHNATDAAAISLAGNMLDESPSGSHMKDLVISLSDVLERYGRRQAASTLRRRFLPEQGR